MSATGQLAARLAALEQQVATLRSQAGGGEQLSPNYLTVNAQGQVGANFTGKVTALGLIIPAQSGPNAGKDTGTDAIQWIRQADGVAVADMFGGQSAAGQATDLQISVLAADAGGGQSAILELVGNLGTSSRVDVKAGTQARTLLTAASQSQFLQLLSTQKLQLDLGKTSYVASAAGWQSATVNFHATFAAAPTFLYSVEVPGGGGATLSGSEARSVGTAAATVDVNPTVAETLTVHWAAIG